MLTLERFQLAITQYSLQFADVLHSCDLRTPVPSCPGWSMAELTRHLGGTQRWAAQIVQTGLRAQLPLGPADRTELEQWFEQGTLQLLGTLRGTPPDRPAWNFGPEPRLASFWSRRQAHEVAVHLWDAMHAHGHDCAIDAQLAADGLDEMCTVILHMRLRQGGLPDWAPMLRLEPCDVDDAVFEFHAPDRDAVDASIVTLRGPADRLLLAMWGRVGMDELDVQGDRASAAALLGLGLTP